MVTSAELRWSSAWELRDRIVAGELSSEELIAACLERIDELEPLLHAFITVAADLALDDARRADAARERGEPLGLLHGIPVAVKDEAWTKDMRSTAGSLLYRDFVPVEDGAVAERLRAAGAVIIGKTNMPEFAAWPRSRSRVAGESVNPWDVRRTSGASSGGSAAALAAGMVPLAVGSDGGGSIRIPASHCGVVGLYPTVGRVSARGSFSYSPYASLGPMARDVRDVATLLQVLSGFDERDPMSADVETPDFLARLDDGVDGMRIGFSPDCGWVDVSDGIVSRVREGVARLERAGATVDELELRLTEVPETFFAASAGYLLYGDGWMPYTRSPEFQERTRSPENRDRLCEYTVLASESPPTSREDYERALENRDRLRAAFDALFADHDVVVTPTMHVTAPLVHDGWGTPYPDPWMGTNFTGLVNILCLTAASYPVGPLDGLPVGLHVIGRAWDEATVLRACRALELVCPWTERPSLTAT
jgi:Asp-tRNA(Asn)/Glu-tRNA(Gln) amidotransferase A subunit family amidase